jgi:hypothetical protein
MAEHPPERDARAAARVRQAWIRARQAVATRSRLNRTIELRLRLNGDGMIPTDAGKAEDGRLKAEMGRKQTPGLRGDWK